jgi:diguanylate cyclase (GGDEF)-like protein
MNTHDTKAKLMDNFEVMANTPEIVDQALLQQLRDNFNIYYVNALKLSLALMKTDHGFTGDDSQIENVERHNNITRAQLIKLKTDIEQRFTAAINQSTNTLDRLLFWSAITAVFLLLLMVVVTVIVSISTKNSFQQVIDRMQALAKGRPDFSQRLQRKHKDELGYLVYWFNKLSDKLEKDYSKIEHRSLTDKLTQISNRTHTDEYLQEQLRQAQQTQNRLIAIIIDIDHFKYINDNHGHLAGDRVLQEFSLLLKENIRSQDFIGRWGGEEFIIIMPNIDPEQAARNIERLREEIEAHDFPKAGKVTASFGVTVSTDDDTPESLIERSDENLYIAKKEGRNKVIFVRNK